MINSFSILFSYEQIISPMIQLIDTIFIYLNTLVYDFISFLYQVFIAIAGAQIFNTEQYQNIANRIYIVIGVISLFLISYVLLRAIINPDNASKGDYSVGKIVPNLLKVIILIAFVPTIFNFAYKIQDIIVATNVIPKLLLGNNNFDNQSNNSNGESDTFSYKESGRTLANTVFLSYLYPKDGIDAQDIEINECFFPAPNCDGIEDTSTLGNITKHISLIGSAAEFISNPTVFFGKRYLIGIIGDNVDKLSSDDRAYTFADAAVEVDSGDKNFQVYANFGKKMHGKDEDKQLEYNGLFQFISGLLVIYVFLNYCIDIGVRAIKLAYFQVIAPVPILTIIIPGQDKIFKNWLKSTITTYIDVFLRILLMFFAVLMINMIPNFDDSIWADSLFAQNLVVQNFARVFLIIGILIFIKQAPKLIEDIFGLKPDLGIKNKLGQMFGIGDAVKNSLSRAEGAITGGTTGALGGAYSAMMNKGNVRKGMKTGFWTGFKGNGNQFKRQMQNIYSQGGGKGVAGAFGGQKWSDRMSDRYKDRYKDDYQDRILTARVSDAIDYKNPNSLVSRYFNDKFSDLNSEVSRGVNKAKNNQVVAENEVNDIRRKFDTNKETKLSNLKNTMGNINAVNSKKFVDAYENDQRIAASLTDMKAAIDNTDAIHAQALNNAQVAFDDNKNLKIKNLRAEMVTQEANFNTRKAQTLASLNRELEEQTTLGNTTRVQEIQNSIASLNSTQFDSAPIQTQIRDLESLKFEDSDAYKQLRAKQEEEMKSMTDKYNAKLVEKSTYEQQYKDLYNHVTEQEKRLYSQFMKEYSSNVEDTEEYKNASQRYDQANLEYNELFNSINEKTELIYREVYDQAKKKRVKKVYNPHFYEENNTLPQYIDLDNEEAVNQCKVTQVEAQALEEAVKELKDKDETFKNLDTKLAQRIRDKEDAEWFKSDEGRHMNMLLKNLKEKDDKPSGEDKK